MTALLTPALVAHHARTLSEGLKAALLAFPPMTETGWNWFRDWSEIVSIRPRGSFRSMIQPLLARGLVEQANPDSPIPGWFYRLTETGGAVRAAVACAGRRC